MKEPYYITTPIYYVTDVPHIGHLYTTVATDIMARYHRLIGREVWFLTGTDEHGQKIEKKAKENGETPKALADRVVERYRDAWRLYGITYDDFIRTTEDRHKRIVQHFMETLIKSGDVYLGEYEGWYCVPDETYWTETQLIEGKCPDCGRPVEKLKEESYFFKMSAFEKRLLDHIEAHPEFIFPESRRNEVLGFIRQGLKDISISRTTIQWGIPMPPDPKAKKSHKVYVWFDALTNYYSALHPFESNSMTERFWPSAIHVVGKDILRFHAVYWPTFLMALNLPLPRQIVAHGWLTDANRKISKSLGNAVDPMALAKEVGVDSTRYFLAREFVFGLDGEYTKKTMYQRINSDLANDFGNSIQRVVSMIHKYFGEHPLEREATLDSESGVKEAFFSALPRVREEMEKFGFQSALEALWVILSSINRYIEAKAPWTLAKAKTPEATHQLKECLLHCHEGLRLVSLYLLPFMPESAQKALEALGEGSSGTGAFLQERGQWGAGPQMLRLSKISPLFPRLEWKE